MRCSQAKAYLGINVRAWAATSSGSRVTNRAEHRDQHAPRQVRGHALDWLGLSLSNPLIVLRHAAADPTSKHVPMPDGGLTNDRRQLLGAGPHRSPLWRGAPAPGAAGLRYRSWA